jgi:signal transduction histidine kinase
MAKVNDNKNRIEFGCEENLPKMQGDPKRVCQILESLLSNACKFTSNGQIVVEVYGRTLGGVMWTVFRVSDTGIGISKELIEFLFNDFTHSDTLAVGKHGHRGLALAIGRRFARMMGGDIEVSSQVGRGSAFTLLLPTKMPTHPCSPHERTAEMPAIGQDLIP